MPTLKNAAWHGSANCLIRVRNLSSATLHLHKISDPSQGEWGHKPPRFVVPGACVVFSTISNGFLGGGGSEGSVCFSAGIPYFGTLVQLSWNNSSVFGLNSEVETSGNVTSTRPSSPLQHASKLFVEHSSENVMVIFTVKAKGHAVTLPNNIPGSCPNFQLFCCTVYPKTLGVQLEPVCGYFGARITGFHERTGQLEEAGIPLESRIVRIGERIVVNEKFEAIVECLQECRKLGIPWKMEFEAATAKIESQYFGSGLFSNADHEPCHDMAVRDSIASVDGHFSKGFRIRFSHRNDSGPCGVHSFNVRLRYEDGRECVQSWQHSGYKLYFRRNLGSNDMSAQCFELSGLPWCVWKEQHCPAVAINSHLQFELQIPKNTLLEDVAVQNIVLESFRGNGGSSIFLCWPQCFEL